MAGDDPAAQPADGYRTEQAQRGLAGVPDVPGWADRFAILGDVNRLRIVLALHCAPGLTVSALAGVVGMTDNAVSHALAALRTATVLEVHREGRYRRWSVRDPAIHQLLHHLGAPHSPLHPEH